MPKKLLSIKNDYVFKKVFTDPDNVDALADFLMAALTLPEEEYGQIEIVDPHIQRRSMDDKLGILDVKLHTRTGKIVHIEVQMANEKCFRERVVDYLARLLTDQMSRGSGYERLRRVISIIITDFTLITENDRYQNRFLLKENDTGILFSDIIEVNVLELAKLPKGEERGALLDWLRFMNAKEEREMEELAERNPKIGKVTAVIKQMSEDEVERAFAEAREKERRIREGQLQFSLEEGIEIGERRGRQENNLEVARNLKRQNVDIEVIASATGLSASEIEQL